MAKQSANKRLCRHHPFHLAQQRLRVAAGKTQRPFKSCGRKRRALSAYAFAAHNAPLSWFDAVGGSRRLTVTGGFYLIARSHQKPRSAVDAEAEPGVVGGPVSRPNLIRCSHGFFFSASCAAAASASLRKSWMSGAPSPKPLWRSRFQSIVARLTFSLSVGVGIRIST